MRKQQAVVEWNYFVEEKRTLEGERIVMAIKRENWKFSNVERMELNAGVWLTLNITILLEN